MNYADSPYKAAALNHQKQRKIATGRSTPPQNAALRRTAAPPEETLHLAEIPTDRMLTTKQAATILGMAAETLKKWRQRGTGPKYLRFPDGTIRYRLSVIMKFLEECIVEP
jgi:hypothetical protein